MELHKVYIWDSKYGIPTNDEEARAIAAKLANTFETEPNPRMVAFGKKMEEFVRPAWTYFEDASELTAMYHVARDTENCLERIYCLGDLPDSYIANSTGIVARAAAENGLVVAREFEYTVQLLLPDGTEYYEGKKSDWRNDAEETEKRWQETLAKVRKRTGKLPKGYDARNTFLSLIIQEKIGKPLDLLCNQYHYIPTRMNYFDSFRKLQTELVDSFMFSTDIETGSENYFTSLIRINFHKEYNDLIDRLMPAAQPSNTDEGAVRQIALTDFYGVSEEENPKVHVGYHSHKAANHKWSISSREEAVVLAEAAADMLMYYLPHIGTAEDFTRFVQAHHAGETNFARLTLPDTNPNKRKFYLEQP
ncbi:hypothetical protein LNQ82_03395 [Conchiformibius steedae DSM 2580]|uniref:Uncharacterized protein n=1 Tax=Conchiformibius steedae DSM 2580 TaxID=1121352 RepID=A0AAE9HUL6_9NEIS|nr:hypothetical protein [Conchiformibius steedae]QMT33559.1 hypothetical protein H3L98_00465 [Conchiformibius steedae]URD68218.1 hypothetical protein LNQ82_03395 [Conchiformibius steedae DSM 2580]